MYKRLTGTIIDKKTIFVVKKIITGEPAGGITQKMNSL
jgi:hypothetical protein